MVNFIEISSLYKLQVFEDFNEGRLNETQRDTLLRIMDRVEELDTIPETGAVGYRNIMAMKKYVKLEKEFITKFDKWDGNSDKLNEKLREYEESKIPLVKEFSNIVSKLKRLVK